MSEIAIRITDIVKEYEVYAKPVDLALEVLTRRARHTKFRALDGVTFDVARGEVIGLIGPNGAGKSTLLKIITGVLEPTSGTVDVSGKVTAILELGLGFSPEYSGRENIYLSGLLYGMDRVEVDRKINSIIDFSGLAEFIERPVKTYSSGMHSRLAFSIATAVDPEILIIDEALAAGDAGFVQKCLRRIRDLCSHGRTVLLVSHGTGLLAQLCNRVVWMDRGRVKLVGQAMPIIQAYDLAAHQSADSESWIETVDDALDRPLDSAEAAATDGAASAPPALSVDAGGPVSLNAPDTMTAAINMHADHAPQGAGTLDPGRQIFRRGPVFIDSISLLNAQGRATGRLVAMETFTIVVDYRCEVLPRESLGVALMINTRPELLPVLQWNSQQKRPTESDDAYSRAAMRPRCARRGQIALRFSGIGLKPGQYLLSLGLLANMPGNWSFYEYRHMYYPFEAEASGFDIGGYVFVEPDYEHIAIDQGDAQMTPSAKRLNRSR